MTRQRGFEQLQEWRSPTMRMLSIRAKMLERGYVNAARDFPDRFPFYNEYQLFNIERHWGMR